jgi:hypothetical protein
MMNPISVTNTKFSRLRGLNYRGNVFNVEWDQSVVTVTLLSGNALYITDSKGQTSKVVIGKPIQLAKSLFSIQDHN